MITFPTNFVPDQLDVLHVGCGPDSFIGNSGWRPNYLATGLYDLNWLCASTNLAHNEQMRQNLHIPTKRCSTRFAGLAKRALKRNGHTVIMITTPTDNHAKLICQAAELGAKYVVCDKPLVTSAAEMSQVKQAVDDSGTRLFLTYNHVYCAPIFEIRQRIAAIGVETIETFFFQEWLNKDQGSLRQLWRTKSPLCGPLDIASHVEHMQSFCLGSPMTRVTRAHLGTGGFYPNIYTNGDFDVEFYSGASGKIRFDQALPGHLDDIGVVVQLKNGQWLMWRLELGVDNLWVSKVATPDRDKLEHWTRHMRGSDSFDKGVNATFNAAPAGHQDGWGTEWQYLFTGIAGAIYADLELDLGFRDNAPPILSIPVPGYEAAKQTAQFIEAIVISHEQRSGSAVNLSEISV
ncbi:MAG: hypothetical protein Greene041662_241 [Candidatus Peregrinibacteria bacterium Greene0416_62]|nr:MAG: hypothetical protein Greene041662_241 [Candidatus Peregrinibacteria bacterium Greene0416_62]TSC98911.1 MAG: hypothetical protein Greene101449_793 [Candidatus Peregrinibacteria bacterium Greene1014_49]